MATAAKGIPGGIGGLAKLTELRQRILFLLGALLVFRICTHIPVPGINPIALNALFDQQRGSILDMFNMFSGGALERFAAGMRELAERAGCHLIGGDLTRGPLSVTVTVAGETPTTGVPLRGAAAVGDAIFVTGQPGRAARGLARRHRVPFLFVECRVDAATQRARLVERDHGSARGGWQAIARRLEAEWEAADELAACEHVVLETTRPVGESLEALEARMPTWPEEAPH